MYICLINQNTMRNIRNSFLAAVMAAALMPLDGCQKPDDGTEGTPPEERTNFFTYDGYTFDILSVVQYDKGDNAVELWLSPTEGLTTTEAIQTAGDYIVLNTHSSYLGLRDRFNGQTSKESFISFGEDMVFAYGNEGAAYIEISKEGDEIKADFMAQNLYSKAAETKAMLSGVYSGKYHVETELPYENEWGIGRERQDVTEASFTTYEDGSRSLIRLYDENGNDVVSLSMDPALVGKTIALPDPEYNGALALSYNSGVEFGLKNAAGTISTSLDNENLEVHINITNGEKQFRAAYKGGFESNVVKQNRYVYDYEGTSSYEGKHHIVQLMVEQKGAVTRFFFSPSEGYTIATSTYLHMPVLSIPSDIINDGRKSFLELSGWEFAFDMMQVWPYDNEYRPYPDASDWIEVNHVNGVYEINMELSSQATGMPRSSIDIYFKGEARN